MLQQTQLATCLELTICLPVYAVCCMQLYSKYTAFLQATGLLQHFVVSSMGANLVLRQQQPAYPLRQ